MPLTMNDPLASITSVRVTERAYDGPRLSMKIVQWAVCPARSVVSGLQSLVARKSALSSTIVPSVSVLSDVSGSGVLDAAVAVLKMVNGWAGLWLETRFG